jgi:UDP-glucose 4-epimerase
MDDYLNIWKNKKILITGGAGAIGSNLTRRISGLGAGLVMVLDDLSASYEWNVLRAQNVMFVRGSVADDVVLKRLFQEEPDYVFHLAAFFANQNSVDYPERDIMVNGLGTLKVLEYANLCNVKKFIYASSGCSIYGNQSPLPLKEEFMSMDLSSPYQITKMLGELYGNFFHHHYGLNVVKTRFFNSYGPGEVPGQYRNVIPNFIYRAMKGMTLPITGSGEETRDFAYVDDLLDGMLRAAYFEEAVGEAMNLASEREIKIKDLAEMINEMTGNKSGIKFAARRKWDTKSRLLASTEKAKRIIGYEPGVSFEEGLKRTVQWFQDNWEKIDESASFGPGISSAVRDAEI